MGHLNKMVLDTSIVYFIIINIVYYTGKKMIVYYGYCSGYSIEPLNSIIGK